MDDNNDSQCLNCNKVIPENATRCPACGWSWQEQPNEANNNKMASSTAEQRVINALENSLNAKSTSGIIGSVLIFFGIIIWVIAYNYRPITTFADAMNRYGTAVMDPQQYHFLVIAAVVMIVAGSIYLGKWIMTTREFSPRESKSVTGLDEIKKAKELLDSGAISADEYEKIKKAVLNQ